MQLGIAGPRGAVHEGSGKEALGVDLADTGLALAGERCVFLQVGQSCGHRRLMGFPGGHTHLTATQGPQGRE